MSAITNATANVPTSKSAAGLIRSRLGELLDKLVETHAVRALDEHSVTFGRVAPDPFQCAGAIGHQLRTGRLRHRPCPLAVDDAHRVEDIRGAPADTSV